MKPVVFSEILGLGEYEAIRSAFRARIIDEKRRRRVKLGDRASCVFENHETALWQIQEMLRTERITKRASVEHEMQTYNALVPGDYELSATIMFEIDDKTERDTFLANALGFERHVHLTVNGERVNATWDPERAHEDQASAVLYLKFPLGEARAAQVRAKTPKIELGVDHPSYAAVTELPTQVVESLAEDLRD